MSLYWIAPLLFSALAYGNTPIITAIYFAKNKQESTLRFNTTGPLEWSQVELPKKNQIIYIFKNVRLMETAQKTLDQIRLPQPPFTFFRSDNHEDTQSITFTFELNPYQMPTLTKESTALTFHFAQPKNTGMQNKELLNRSPTSEEEEPVNPQIQEFLTAQTEKKFKGKSISLQAKDADVRDILKMIGEASGFNIIIADSVHGKMNISLIDVPWDQALEVVLSTNHLGAERVHNILKVMPLDSLKQEKEELIRTKLASQAAEPRATRIFSINYAILSDLQTEIKSFVSALATGGSNNSSNLGGLVQTDTRTNSLIVYDTLDNLDKIKKLIDVLDIPTPQIMIEAKIIEANDEFSNTLSGSLGFSDTGRQPYAFSTLGANPLTSLFSTPAYNFASASSSIGEGTGVTFGAAPVLGFLGNNFVLNALLNWGESQSIVKIVASPKTVVLNRTQAKITHGTPVSIPSTTTISGVGTVPVTTVQNANISLQVTPSVTNDGSILLDLSISKDLPEVIAGGTSSSYGIATRTLDTKVLVDDNSTLVIGGLYQLNKQMQYTGVPYLRKIPMIGFLFGSEGETIIKNELFIFITPKIINTREATTS